MSFFGKIFALLLALFAADAAVLCAEPLRVAASFTIPADWVREIGKEHVSVVSIAPPDADPHTYQPVFGDMRQLRRAALVVGIDPALESWFTPLVAEKRSREKTLWLSAARPEKPEPPELQGDPHLWMDPLRVIPMTNLLAERLAAADPANAAAYAANAAAYAVALRALAKESRKKLAAVPAPRRVLFSHHDNLRRLAASHGLRFGGSLLASPSSEASDPSAAEFGAFVRRARAASVPLFYDGAAAAPLVQTATRAASLPPPVRLRADALSAPDGPAANYLAMHRENIRLIAAALNPAPAPKKPQD